MNIQANNRRSKYDKKTFLTLIILLFVTMMAVGQPRPRPNILFVMSDDHSAAHVGAYGNADIKTPNLDAFAKEGMLFKRAYVSTPQCVPSRATLMTGRAVVICAIASYVRTL